MPDPLLFVRDGAGWRGQGGVERAEFAGPDPIGAARAWWEARRPAPGEIAFGAFPFDPSSPAGGVLLVPDRVTAVAPGDPLGAEGLVPPTVATDDLMPSATYLDAVRRAADAITRGELAKVVLARDIRLRPSEPVDLGVLVARLHAADPSAAVFAIDGLVGASPETLVAVHDGQVTARVLAGTAAPGAGDRLRTSPKDLAEHALAASSVRDALAPHVDGLRLDGPFVLELPQLVHLATDISGRIADGSDALALVAALHPTAAVAGVPRDAALDQIRTLELADRGRYAGPVGWVDAKGDGEWAIALRSAQRLPDGTFRAYAGAGIMGASDPAAELAETELKLRAIRAAFGLHD